MKCMSSEQFAYFASLLGEGRVDQISERVWAVYAETATVLYTFYPELMQFCYTLGEKT